MTAGKYLPSLAAKIIIVAMSSLAFSRVAYTTRQQVHKSNWKRFSTLEPFSIDTTNGEIASSFNPLGPPDFLSNLSVGESIRSYGKNITRLSSSPDIFLVKDLISTDDRNTLMEAAETQGMKVAGTRQSGENTVRKNSYLAWIDPYSITTTGEGSDWRDAPSVARETIVKSRLCFAHDVMNDLINDVVSMDFCFAEDLQVAKYDKDGRFDYHHDGYSRYLTVLSYLNGVGGTFFPFGGMRDELEGIDFSNEDEVSVLSFKRQLERCGILIVGEEGSDGYLQSAFVKPKQVVHIEAGDAIAFYNYMSGGEKDLRVLHCSLPVPQEKWISTAWFRSEALTGPFASFKKAQLVESFYGAKSMSPS
ncbi:hypothetical protein ACHAXM_009594 [Skeletonema potamos]|jgi:hypothetical protein